MAPFRWSLSPARPTHSSNTALASATDASLSDPKTWPRGARGSAPAASLGVAGCEERCGKQRPRASPSPVAADGCRLGRSAVHGHIQRTNAAARGTGRKPRPEKFLNPTGSKPPISGHGAQIVMKVQSSDATGDPEGSRVGALGPSLIWWSRLVARPPPSGLAPRHPGPVKCRPLCLALFTVYPRIAVHAHSGWSSHHLFIASQCLRGSRQDKRFRQASHESQ